MATSRGLRVLKAIDILTTIPSFEKAAVLKQLKLTSAANGTIKGSFMVDADNTNIGGGLHGGYIASVIDILSFFTLLTNRDGRVSWTTNMMVNYIAPALKGEKVNVETKSIKSGSSAVVETYLHNEKGVLLAKGTTSFLAGNDSHQKIVKDRLEFDVHEN